MEGYICVGVRREAVLTVFECSNIVFLIVNETDKVFIDLIQKISARSVTLEYERER